VEITGYEVIPYVPPNAQGVTAGAAFTFHSTKTTETLSPLGNGVPYTFTVEALSAAGASAPSAPTNLVVVSLKQELKYQIAQWVKMDNIEGVAAAVVMPRPGDPSKPSVKEFFMGNASLGGPAVTAGTQFPIASLTKTFTGALLAYMISDRDISISDPLQNFAPAGYTIASNDGHDITIQDLATHYAGLPDNPPNAGPTSANYSETSMWEALTEPLPLIPGEQWQYSNFGVGTLGTVLANLYDPGQSVPPYEAAIEDLITGPLHMGSTYIEPGNPTTNMATGYQYSGITQVPQPQSANINNGAMAGNGGLISDLHDMTLWVKAETGFANADSSFLPATLEPIVPVTAQCDNNVSPCVPMPPPPQIQMQMGMTWQLYHPWNNLGTVAFKDGGNDGFSSAIMLLPAEKYGVVVLDNDSSPPADPNWGGPDSLANTLLTEVAGVAPIPGYPPPHLHGGPPPPTLPPCTKSYDCT
jgi:CubicO group peptidase (beta-lactamase class C family)